MSSKTELEAQLSFVSFCIEEYKIHHRMSGTAVALLFKKYGVIDYLMDHFELLHSFGRNSILSDIDDFIAERKQQK